MIGIIYKFTIILSGKFYVGQTFDALNFNKYWGSGAIWRKCVKNIRVKFPTCWEKLIKREIIWKGECTQKLLDKLEEVYIRKEKSLHILGLGGCNILPGTANKFGGVNPNSIESCRKKQSKSLKKWWMKHPEYRIKLSERRRNSKSSKETREKISKALVGRFVGEKNSMFGKKMSEETRKKMSIAQSKRKHRKPHSEESKRKMSESRRDKYKGENHPLYGSTFIWITNGRNNKRFSGKEEEIPVGWKRGKVENKKKI